MNALTALLEAVSALEAETPGLLEQCTDPEGRDAAELFGIVQGARKALQDVERTLETAAYDAMTGDDVQAGDLWVERYRSTDRKAWQHDEWQRDVRTKVLQVHGLKGAQGVLTADGEVAPISVLHEVLRAVEGAHGSAAPKTTALRALGLDARDYCESSPGAKHVRVQRRVETETEGAA
jgi:hypothetical protein